MAPARSSALVVSLVVTLAGLATAVEPAAVAKPVQIFVADSFADLSPGTRVAVSVDPLGTLQLGRRLAPLATLAEPFVFSAAADRDGWIVGTGSSGRVLRIRPDGSVVELFAAPEPEVFAVLAFDGNVFAATSPDGKVYRIARDGTATTFFDPPDRYVWALARDRRGDLLVATGLDGRLYRVRNDGSSEVVLETPDRHLRSLAVLADGSILAGTAGEGKILRLAGGAKEALSTVHDSTLTEIVALVARPDGGAWAVALASEASLLDLSGRPPATIQGEGVTVVVQEATSGSRPGGATGPRSVILDLAPGGAVDELGRFDDRTVHSALLVGEELWLGTGEEGELFRVAGRRLILEKDFEERQVPALAAGPAGAAVLTANGVAAYRLGGELEQAELEQEGVFTSQVLDAGQPARFGSLRWEGQAPRGTGVEVSARSGMSQEPDDTWTAWTPAAEGREASLAALSPGRYFQWRATLRGPGATTPTVTRVEVSYRQENQRPAIAKLTVLEPGQILVPQSFNPGNQVYEPWSPNQEGIFTTLTPASSDDDASLKTLWKKGYRTVRWEASDPNGDALRYTLEVRPAGDDDGDEDGEATGDEAGGGDEKQPWLTVAEDLEETHLGFDATVLPDGRYRFRLTASDLGARPAGEALAARELSELVTVDLTPARLVAARRQGDRIRVELADSSPLLDVALSADAGAWEEAIPVDGLLDGRRETLDVAVPAAAHVLLLRVTDSAGNVVTFDLLAEAAKDR